MIRLRWILTLMTLFLGLVLLFQNCSRANLVKYENVSEYQAPTTSLKASACGESRTATASTGKFIFIIDMSASNIGEWYLDSAKNSYFWDKSKATDIDGDRFAAIEAFLDNFTAGTDQQFAIIGFSNGAGIIDFQTRGWKRDGLSFVSSATAKTQLQALKDLQASDYKWYNRWDRLTGIAVRETVPSSILMQATSYTAALAVAENIVIKDLFNTDAHGSSYRIFFMSDGAPVDPINGGCNVSAVVDKEACYREAALQSLTMMGASALARGRDLKVNGIFYSKSTNVPSQILDTISQEGGTGTSLKLTDFKSQKNILSKLASSSSSLDIRPDSLQAFVLTTIRKGGKLYSDIDMDGLSDVEEMQLGSDPQNPRSKVSGVLDGICLRFGSFDACEQKRAAIKCNPDLMNNLFLTDCDYKILGLDKLANSSDSITNWGIDTDKDGVPDFVEIIKGLNPAVADTFLDTDGDGTSNLEEVILGRDPNVPDADISLTRLNQYSIKFNPEPISYCTTGAWELKLERMQVVKTFELANPQTPALNHAANQHVVFFNYRRSALNSQQSVWEVQSRIVKINYEKKSLSESLLLNESWITPTDFENSGSVKK